MHFYETNLSVTQSFDDGISPQNGLFGEEPGDFGGETRAQLLRLAQEVLSEISDMDASHKDGLLNAFVLELLLLSKEQEFREKRRRRQAEGIAAAKARGVRFGPRPRALPERFEELRQAWRNGELSLKLAAETCGLPKSTFRDAALRAEREETA